MAILSNQVECLNCRDKPYSAHRHDFKWCKCGAVAVDGGMDYLKRVGSGYKDMSIIIPDEHLEGLTKALSDPSRNTLGHLCNVARYLRDNMDINIGKDYDEDK